MGLPDGNITCCFRKASKSGFVIQQGELCWTLPQQGKITRIPNAPLISALKQKTEWQQLKSIEGAAEHTSYFTFLRGW